MLGATTGREIRLPSNTTLDDRLKFVTFKTMLETV
jgi:hypothetical protein